MQLFTLHTPVDDNGYQSIHLAVATAPNHRKHQKDPAKFSCKPIEMKLGDRGVGAESMK